MNSPLTLPTNHVDHVITQAERADDRDDCRGRLYAARKPRPHHSQVPVPQYHGLGTLRAAPLLRTTRSFRRHPHRNMQTNEWPSTLPVAQTSPGLTGISSRQARTDHGWYVQRSVLRLLWAVRANYPNIRSSMCDAISKSVAFKRLSSGCEQVHPKRRRIACPCMSSVMLASDQTDKNSGGHS